MTDTIRMLDVVALTDDIRERDLQRGQVGTVVEVLSPDMYEVEFTNNDGRTYAELAINADKLLVLHYELAGT